MSFASVPHIIWFLILGIANLAAIIAWVAIIQRKASRRQRQAALVNVTIRDYFRHSGVDVAVASVTLGKDRRFTAFIESEPMKRFRLSHIIETTLREHVAKTCKLELDKIYWRFPIKEITPAKAGTEDQPAKDSDEYINEGLVPYRHLPKVDVHEISWEKFEEFTTSSPNAAGEPAPAEQAR
ncbi:hypothetical protein D3878_23025 [Noviherbaspirillum sedimenti]|uniref:Uncharacterized protein n=2 Tax=Noviherbaspirillum sedimenti TaxID=2320865 RepID=A0A3A3G8X4_9BURK|nr:hypothetical protein D3878_23025 [Noviherbaspirillum sedimenti]